MEKSAQAAHASMWGEPAAQNRLRRLPLWTLGEKRLSGGAGGLPSLAACMRASELPASEGTNLRCRRLGAAPAAMLG